MKISHHHCITCMYIFLYIVCEYVQTRKYIYIKNNSVHERQKETFPFIKTTNFKKISHLQEVVCL